jgi:hypothetical protein
MSSYVVELRRPLHMESPVKRFVRRWRERRRRPKRDRSHLEPRWYDAFDVPGDWGVAAVVVALLAIILLIVAGPWLWLIVLLLVDAIVWVVLAAVGVTAALVLRRPWRVVIVDDDGRELAWQEITGRRAARRHVDVVRSRLKGSVVTDLQAAVRHP